MRKTLFRLWMLALPMLLGLASCSDNDDNPVTDPDEPQQEQALADYAILWYGHGGGNLDMLIMDNMMHFYMADGNSYDNVKIAAQYKYSSLENLQDTYEEYSEALADHFEPGTPDYDAAVQQLEMFRTSYYPIFHGEVSEEDAEPWGSTLDATYGQLRFDQLTGWSRWLRLNQQEPNPECYTGYNPFESRSKRKSPHNGFHRFHRLRGMSNE